MTNKYLQEKYISLIGSRLRNYRKKSNRLYNFSCPFCGDSKTNKHKARGYLFEKKGSFFYKCHNCDISKSFSSFLKILDLTLYNEYVIDCLRDAGQYIEPDNPVKPSTTKYDTNVFKELKRISDLPETHMAKSYVLKRLIPGKYHSMLYYVPNYQVFVNNLIPNKLSSAIDGPRLIIPFYSYNKDVVGFQGRALDGSDARYISIMFDDDQPGVFGLPDINFNKKYYILEGPIDSMFLDNAIGMANSDFMGGLRRLDCNRENVVFVWDNEPRHDVIVNKMKEAIKANYSVVIWPSDLTFKDINDMICGGYSPSKIQHIIDTNTFTGLQASLALNNWSKL